MLSTVQFFKRCARSTGLAARLVVVSACLLLALAAPPMKTAEAAETNFITIATGGVTGVYYPAGGSICHMVNKGRKDHGVRCTIESTGGSGVNTEKLRYGEVEFGIVQSDIHYQALHGQEGYLDIGPFEELRSVFALHPEPFTVVARKDSNIKTIQDLKDKRVNIGNPGSGQRGTMETLMRAMGWDKTIFSEVYEFKASEQSRALCSNDIDAMVFTVGHPNASITEAATFCDSILVDVSGPEISKLVAKNDYFRHVIIPGDMYEGTPTPTHTFGVGATLVTTSRIGNETVYRVVKSVFEDMDTLRNMHPAFANLKKEDMVSGGLSAPLHPGAEQYFREVGLIK